MKASKVTVDYPDGMQDVFTAPTSPPPPPPTVPAAPTNLTAAAASATSISLKWADISTTETGYRIERSINGTTFAQIATKGANVKAYTAGGLTASTKYYFRVRAYNSAGNSAYSNAASATTMAQPTSPPPPPPPPPTGGGDVLGPYTKPSASNTGLTNSAILVTVTTDFVTSANGQLVENKLFLGRSDVAHANVTFRNCKFVNGGVVTTDENHNLVEDLRAVGTVAENCDFQGSGTFGRGISLKRCRIYGLRDTDFSRNPGDCFWESCYFDDWFASTTDAHMDAVQWYWGYPGVAPLRLNFAVRGCYFNIDPSYEYANQMNAVLFLCANSGYELLTHITVEYNWFRSGGFVIRMFTKDDPSIQLNHNIWEGWGWGPILASRRPGHGINNVGFTGNQIWLNGTLQPFQKPGGTNGDYWGFE